MRALLANSSATSGPVTLPSAVAEDHDTHERGRRAEQPLGFGEHGLVGDDKRFGFAVANDVVPVAGILRFVHGHEGGAEPAARVRDDGPLHAVVRDDRHAVAGADAEGGQRAAEAVDLRAEFGITHPLPAAVRLLRAEEVARTVGLDAVIVYLDQRLEARHKGHTPAKVRPARVAGKRRRHAGRGGEAPINRA